MGGHEFIVKFSEAKLRRVSMHANELARHCFLWEQNSVVYSISKSCPMHEQPGAPSLRKAKKSLDNRSTRLKYSEDF